MLDKMDFVIMPVLNVDGYAFTWQQPVCIHYQVFFFVISNTREQMYFNFSLELLTFTWVKNAARLTVVIILGEVFFKSFAKQSRMRCQIEKARALAPERTQCLLFPK